MGKLTVGALLMFVAVWVLRERARARAQAQETEGACINCLSTDVERDEKRARCRACGFEFSADGGGALTPEQVGSMFERD